MSDFWIKAKIVFDRGRNWIGYITFLMLIFVTITSMREYPIFSWLSSWYWLLIVLVASIFLMLLLGYLELKTFSIYQKEREIYASLDPVQMRVFDNQGKILAKLDKLENRMDKLEKTGEGRKK